LLALGADGFADTVIANLAQFAIVAIAAVSAMVPVAGSSCLAVVWQTNGLSAIGLIEATQAIPAIAGLAPLAVTITAALGAIPLVLVIVAEEQSLICAIRRVDPIAAMLTSVATSPVSAGEAPVCLVETAFQPLIVARLVTSAVFAATLAGAAVRVATT